MNRLLLMAVGAALGPVPAAAQAPLPAQGLSALRLGAIVGGQYNSFDRHFAVSVSPELYTFSLGAGSAWLKNRWVVGAEFLFSSGTKTEGSQSLQYDGFRTNLSVGYNLLRGSNWRLEPTVGFAATTSQLIAQTDDNSRFQNLANNQAGLSAGLALANVNALGLSTGVRVGYFAPFGGRTAWEFKGSGTDAGLQDNMQAFFIHLTIGGLLTLRGNDQPAAR